MTSIKKQQQNIAQWWDQEAESHPDAHNASWQDSNMVELEIQQISSRIPAGSVVLDAGCGPGYSTLKIAQATSPTRVRAFDFSEGMLKIAQARHHHDNISFYRGDITSIHEQNDYFDVAYTTRVVINLPSWELQQQALTEIHRVLKPGGLYILSEEFSGSLGKLNAFRELAGLEPLTNTAYNLLLDETQLEKFISGKFDLVEINRFSSLYYLGSRLIRELAMAPGETPSYSHPVNQFFANLEITGNSGDFGPQKMYILRKSG